MIPYDDYRNATPDQALRMIRLLIMQRFGNDFGEAGTPAEVIKMVDNLCSDHILLIMKSDRVRHLQHGCETLPTPVSK